MKYTLQLDQKPTHMHVVVTGQNSPETVSAYVAEVVQECVERGCSRLLVEERLEGPRLGMLDVFKLVSEGSTRFQGALKSIAFVDVNRAGDLMQFAETVALNRGIPLVVFPTVDAAERWLIAVAQADENTALPSDRDDKPAQ
jgi:hypothetical protein